MSNAVTEIDLESWEVGTDVSERYDLPAGSAVVTMHPHTRGLKTVHVTTLGAGHQYLTNAEALDGISDLIVPGGLLTAAPDKGAKSSKALRSVPGMLDPIDVEYEASKIRTRKAAKEKVAAEDADRAGAPDYDLEFLNRDELNALPPPEYLIDGVIPRHSYGIISGRDQSFKSFAALDMALALATGRPWHGHIVQGGRVLYIAGEGAYGLAGRVRAWEAHYDIEIDPESLTIRKSALDMHKPGAAFQHLLAHVEEGKYGLVIVDTLRRVSGSADGNGSEMGAVIDNVDQIKRATADGTVIVVAHTDKGDNDSRGYSGIEDDADFVWHAKRSDSSLALKAAKMKDGPDGHSLHFKATPVSGSLILEVGAPAKRSNFEAQAQIIETMIDCFPGEVASGILKSTSGLSGRQFYPALEALVQEGHLVGRESGRSTFYTRVPVEFEGQ